MKKTRRVMAMIGIIFLVAIYASTLVFALMKSPMAERLLMASVFSTIAVPVILYGMILVAQNMEDRRDTPSDEQDDDSADS